jgi:hypothetical protein
MTSVAQARFILNGCNRCGHVRRSHQAREDGSLPLCRSCQKSWPGGARHVFEPHQIDLLTAHHLVAIVRGAADLTTVLTTDARHGTDEAGTEGHE